MSTALTWQITSKDSDATEQIGEQLGRRLRGGEVIELVSDLGGGKTTFVRGLARGLGSTDHVASPTFTITKVYKKGRLELHHFDFYRLPDAGLMAHELHDVLNEPKIVVVVEWADVVRDVLPAQRITVTIDKLAEEGRRLTFNCPPDLAYVKQEQTA